MIEPSETARPRDRAWPALLAATATLVGMLACSAPDRAMPPAEVGYRQYCASCHGIDGKGDGPLATSLERRPSDLTRLAARAGGFDARAVLAAIDGRRRVAEHGPREMPVWGAVFVEALRADDKRYPGYTALLSGTVLVEYVRELQEQ